MPTFDTPRPITVVLDLSVADLRIVASDRTETVVDVRPSEAHNQSHVRAAEQTRVEFENGRLHITSPKRRIFLGGRESVDITVELPSDSRLHGDGGVCTIRSRGRLGECTLKVGVGQIDLDHAGPLRLETGSGSINVAHAVGETDIHSGNGAIGIREVEGVASIKNSNGATTIGSISGELKIGSANGKITVDRAGGSVTAKTANGAIRIGEVVRGAVLVESAHGALEIGIRNGTAAWLDVSSKFGKVRNSLDETDGPAEAQETVEVRARTGMGDISVYRSTQTPAPGLLSA